MYNNDANPHKTEGTGAKPCRIELRTGETVDAVHHFVNKHGWVCVYDTHRSHGIAQKIPPSNVAKIELRNPPREERDIQTDAPATEFESIESEVGR